MAVSALLLLSLCACGASAPRPVSTTPAEPLQGTAAAEALLAEAEQSGGVEAARLKLKAASLYLDAGQPEAAVATLNGISSDAAATDLWQRDFMLANIYLDHNQAQQAMKLLRPPVAGVDAAMRSLYLRTRARTQLELGDTMGAIRTIATGDDPTLHDELWQQLRTVPLSRLKQQQTVAMDVYSGWIELAIINKELVTSAENWSTAIVFWLQQYPMHPAQDSILPLLRQQNYERHRGAGQVAVLLPRSGRLLPQASSIEHGILSAWYSDSSKQQPVLRFYDSAKGSVDELYQRAVRDGAELVIGPLTRGNVDVINALDKLPVPVLALNTGTAGAATTENYYEFSLNPEDEIEQIVQKAWFDGHQAALTLVHDSDYGRRLERVFKDKWQALGGLLVSSEILASDQDGIKAQLGALLHVRISRLRIERLEETLGISLTAPNRGRGDVGCIFLVAPGDIARQIGPQLRFLDLEYVQVYATSDIYHGNTDREAALDMDLIQFPAMPWLLDPTPTGGEDMNAIDSGKPGSPELFAFGIDAYNTGLQIEKLAAQDNAEYPGETGTLRLNGHRINRKMTWAIFYGGNATTISLYEKSLDSKLRYQ